MPNQTSKEIKRRKYLDLKCSRNREIIYPRKKRCNKGTVVALVTAGSGNFDENVLLVVSR